MVIARLTWGGFWARSDNHASGDASTPSAKPIWEAGNTADWPRLLAVFIWVRFGRRQTSRFDMKYFQTASTAIPARADRATRPRKVLNVAEAAATLAAMPADEMAMYFANPARIPQRASCRSRKVRELLRPKFHALATRAAISCAVTKGSPDQMAVYRTAKCTNTPLAPTNPKEMNAGGNKPQSAFEIKKHTSCQALARSNLDSPARLLRNSNGISR